MPLTCTILDAAPVWGGKILTHRVGQLVMEAGPDSFLSQKPWGMELCRRLRLADQLMFTISDEGEGFDWRGYLEFSPERAFDPNGRGIALARLASFSSLDYRGCGNIVVVTVAAAPRSS